MSGGSLPLLPAVLLNCALITLGALVYRLVHGPLGSAAGGGRRDRSSLARTAIAMGIAIGVVWIVTKTGAFGAGGLATLGVVTVAGYVGADLVRTLLGRITRARQATRSDLGRNLEITELAASSHPAADISLAFDESVDVAREPQSDPRAVGMFFATTRAEAGPAEVGTFSGERADGIALGKAFVRIPESHRLGNVELPMRIRFLAYTMYEQVRDPAKHFVLRSVQVLAADEWCRQIASFPSDTALVFVHGYNTSFDEAVFRNAQMLWDLQFRGVSVVFSWPSRANAPDYKYDIDSAMGARPAFIRVLELLGAQSNIKRIHILAHSMGNLLVLDALTHHRHDLVPLSLGELMMAAPDVDRDLYRSLAPAVRKATGGMTLYASSADRALRLSKLAAGNIPRAGDVMRDGPVVLPEVDAIDVTAVGNELFGFNHTVFAQGRSILNDIGLLMSTGTRPPDARLAEIRPVPETDPTPQYWRYAP